MIRIYDTINSFEHYITYSGLNFFCILFRDTMYFLLTSEREVFVIYRGVTLMSETQTQSLTRRYLHRRSVSYVDLENLSLSFHIRAYRKRPDKRSCYLGYSHDTRNWCPQPPPRNGTGPATTTTGCVSHVIEV